MKQILFTLLVMWATQSWGQNSLTVHIIDSATVKPVDYAEVILHHGGSELSAITDEKGSYAFTDLKSGQYEIYVKNNFDIVYQEKFELNGSLDKKIYCHASLDTLDEVIITSKIFHKESDKLIYEVAQSPKAKGNNAYDLLKETPMVSNMKGTEFKILGNAQAVIYVNGRKTNMDAEAVAEYLKSLPSEQIRRIEVITNPGSEYQVEANEGIINVVLKKQQSDGYNGTIKMNNNLRYYYNYGGGVNLNFRSNNFALNTSVNGSSYKERDEYNLSNGNDTFRSETKGFVIDPNLNFGTQINAEYALSKKQILGANYRFRYNKSFGSVVSVDNYTDGLLQGRTKNMENAATHNHLFSIYYELATDDNGSKLAASGTLLKYRRLMDNQNEYIPYDAGDYSALRQSVPQYITNMGGIIDYKHRWNRNVALLTGVSWTETETDNNTQQEDLTDDGYKLNESLSNHFQYNEQILGAYGALEAIISEKITAKGGLRIESTRSKGIVIGKEYEINRNYYNLLPTANINYSPDKNNTITYSFSSRIKRPAFWELNPSRKYFTPTNYIQNNPFVLPAKYYNQELMYMLKEAYYGSIQYRIVNDAFGQIPMQGIMVNNATQEETRFLRYIRTNYGKSRLLSFTIGMDKSWFDGIWSMNYLASIDLETYKGTITKDPTSVPVEGYTEILFPYTVDNSNRSYTIQLNNNIRLSNKKDWYLGVNYWYMSPRQMEIGLLAHQQNLSLSVKKIWDNWTILAEAGDIFHTQIDNITGSQAGGYYNNIRSDEYNNEFSLKITYNFGNKKLKKAREFDTMDSTIKGRL
jgi:hypothetical protein